MSARVPHSPRRRQRAIWRSSAYSVETTRSSADRSPSRRRPSRAVTSPAPFRMGSIIVRLLPRDRRRRGAYRYISIHLQLAHRPYLDAADARGRDPGGEVDRLVQVAGVDQVEARELLLGLGERTVGERQPAVADAHGGGGLDGLERL